MKIKEIIKRILGVYEYDREAERLINKSIEIYHKKGKFNYWRSIRLHNRIRSKFNCYIYPGIEVGNNFYIAHSLGITIGKTTVIGNNCKVYPNCSIVAALKNDEIRLQKNERRHAKIGDDCIIGCGSVIIGPITIGNDVTIGAGAIVTKDVPSHTIVKNVNEFTQK